jgi:hypothetical protein
LFRLNISRMRCALLEQAPEILSHPFQFAQQLPVPDAFDLNPVGSQKGIAFGIVRLFCWMATPGAVGFNDQPRFGTVEIQKVFFEWMLPAEFVSGETPFAQQASQLFFRPGLNAAKSSGAFD